MEKVFLISSLVTLGVTGLAGLSTVTMQFLAQSAAPSEIVGTTGWVGAGLLGAVLLWLMGLHLPAKDKQLKEMTDSKDAITRELNKTKDDQLREVLAQHKAALELKDKAYEALILLKDKQLELKDALIERCRVESNLSLKLISDEYRSTVKDVTVLSTNLRYKSRSESRDRERPGREEPGYGGGSKDESVSSG